MESASVLEVACDVCRQKVAGGLRTWKRRMPSHATVAMCAACSYRLARNADGRGLESEDMMHMASVYGTLAGEVWGDADRVYWFRQPFVHQSTSRIADLLDREQMDTKNLSDLTRRELLRAGVKL